MAGCSGKRPSPRQVPDWVGIGRQMGRDGIQYRGSPNRYNSILRGAKQSCPVQRAGQSWHPIVGRPIGTTPSQRESHGVAEDLACQMSVKAGAVVAGRIASVFSPEQLRYPLCNAAKTRRESTSANKRLGSQSLVGTCKRLNFTLKKKKKKKTENGEEIGTNI